MEKGEMEQRCAELLHDLRKRHGLSKTRMALELMVDPHTVTRWERGQSIPTVAQFAAIFAYFQEDVLKYALNLIYPETYKDTEDAKAGLIHYIEHVATDKEIQGLSFFIFGKHGSNFGPQIQELVMLDHLPLVHRYAVAEMIDTYYKLAEERGELLCDGQSMPDCEIFREGLRKGKSAVVGGYNSYSAYAGL